MINFALFFNQLLKNLMIDKAGELLSARNLKATQISSVKYLRR